MLIKEQVMHYYSEKLEWHNPAVRKRRDIRYIKHTLDTYFVQNRRRGIAKAEYIVSDYLN